jgi:chorismate-pyruvate lyase
MPIVGGRGKFRDRSPRETDSPQGFPSVNRAGLTSSDKSPLGKLWENRPILQSNLHPPKVPMITTPFPPSQSTTANPSPDQQLRPDLQESLAHSRIDPAKLSVFQRIILTTDGTLTEILEAFLFEKIRIIKLSEENTVAAQDLPALELTAGHDLIQRRVLLQGKISHINWIYAESVIVPDRLDDRYRDRLLHSQESIGRLWLEHRVETYKEIIDSARHPAGNLASHLAVSPDEFLFSRTYRVFSGGHPIMTITEKFPEKFFINPVN